MKALFIFLILSSSQILLPAQVEADSNNSKGEQYYKTYCSACHGNTGGMDMSKRIAPPIMGVRRHYISVYPDKDSFILAVTSWVAKQDAENSLMRGAIMRFNIMPPIIIDPEIAEEIAEYIYEGNIEMPKGFGQHVKERHGQ